ncbi:hypothetical protein [Streptomyces sp. NPDC087512]|uniref:hypothetical protein n=1 Tax=unclassified Streptomyces TaxID=2593676 RepID=UPI00341733E2
MTTASSSPRSPEDVISTMDPPAGETTAGTGTHTVGPRPDRSDEERSDEDLFDEDLFTGLDLDGNLGTAEDRRPDGTAEYAAPEAAAPEEVPWPHGDPVGDLVRAAVAGRPLEEVADLITMLEQSPRYAGATGDALRAAGVERPVEDVARLAALLTRPPRHPDSADEAIRAAVEYRSVEDVTRLMALLHRTPLEPQCGRAAVRAAAVGRPVEELVELIGRLAEDEREYYELPAPPPYAPARTYAAEAPGTAGDPGTPAAAERRERRRPALTLLPSRSRGRTPRDGDPAARWAAGLAMWPTWLTVATLAGCGVAYFPLHQDGTSAGAYAVALGLSALCLVVALLLTLRAAVPVLAAAVVAPAALAAARLYGTATPSPGISGTVGLTLAPAWAAVAAAVLASLVALTALCVRVAGQEPARPRPARPVAFVRRVVD